MFRVDEELLGECRQSLGSRSELRWVLGGSGSGKSTVCRVVNARFGVPVIDMDARVYGSFHALHSAQRHPVSCAWAHSEDRLRWLLEMPWDEFDSFHRATLPENLDLLVRELAPRGSTASMLVDGGLCHPALLATVVPASSIVCLVRDGLDSEALWREPGERAGMRESVLSLDHSGALWRRFLDFDRRITQGIMADARSAAIGVVAWGSDEGPDAVAERVRARLDLGAHPLAQQRLPGDGQKVD